MSRGGIRSPGVPPGYYGPLLIVVCGLLFYVGRTSQAMAASQRRCCRTQFWLYGLSIIALLLAVRRPWPALHADPGGGCCMARDLADATLPAVSAVGVRRWLYHEVMLHYLPYPWYFVGVSPPG